MFWLLTVCRNTAYSVSMPNYDPPLKKALDAAGGPVKLARALGIGASAVTQWTRVPPRHVPMVEQITGIAGRELRPDLWGLPAKDAA